MLRNRLIAALLLGLVALLTYAWIDGGREPMRSISEPVVLPGAQK